MADANQPNRAQRHRPIEEVQCFRCRLYGHRRADRHTPQCYHCKAFGHSKDICPISMGNPEAAAQFTEFMAAAFAAIQRPRPGSNTAPLRPRVEPNNRIQKVSSSSLITQILERFHWQWDSAQLHRIGPVKVKKMYRMDRKLNRRTWMMADRSMKTITEANEMRICNGRE